ncbi:oxidation resistance protein 1-like isoform X4 [Biomphalaria glabrata]|uniref:Oxidation resistance protein 1 n=1 Tax=Biomphalaria glabrata TaxID=6526 RepID=A0A9W2Z9S5_BIOGL|nr:oxidation resistance protein 1-like isoform X4 [Biomphalaria glabrata]
MMKVRLSIPLPLFRHLHWIATPVDGMCHCNKDLMIHRLSTVSQCLFRSGSVDADKSQNFNLGLEETGARSRSYSSTDSENGSKRDNYAYASPRHPSNEKVWTIASPFSPPLTSGPPLNGASTKQTPGFLSELSLKSTPVPVDAGTSPTSRPLAGSLKDISPMSANELHDSVLSALSQSDGFDSGYKASLEKKVSNKQKPKGTIEYQVKDGDTLVKIGAHFDVTPSELIKINRLVSRTVFVGQTLFIPDPSEPPSPPSPPPDTRPKVDVPLPSLKDGPMPSIPGHAVPVSNQLRSESFEEKISSPKSRLPEQTSQEETDRECMQKFVKGPARRVMEEEEDDNSSSNHEGIIIKGTLLVTPNAIMFDPDASDLAVVSSKDASKFGMVVYMDEIKSVALFHDFSPRMFWRQPKEIRAHSPKPEPYRPAVEGQADEELEQDNRSASPMMQADSRPAPDGASVAGDTGQSRPTPYGEDTDKDDQGAFKTGRTSEELEEMADLSREHHDSPPQQGRASEEVANTMTQSPDSNVHSPLVKQMSRSSELEVSEMALLQDSPDGIGETRDFGPHMGRSSSEVHRHTSSSLGRVSDSSPGDTTGRSFFAEPGDSAGDSLGTPTQGFSPLHFTDRSPKSVLAHPKPVPGQPALHLSQSSGQYSDLKAQKILEDPEAVVNVPQTGTADSSLDSGSGHHTGQQSLAEDIAKLALEDYSKSGLSGEGSIQNSLESSHSNIDGETKPSMSKSPHLLVDTKLGADNSAKADDPSKSTATTGSASNSPLSTFSPLRAQAQLSNIFSYTSSFIQNIHKTYKSSAPALSALTAKEIGRMRAKSSPVFPSGGLQLRSGFTKEDMEKILGPDPKDYLHPTDSPHFEQPPLYLQIRPGIKKTSEFRQPRAFDHRNHKLLEEYWLIVPREMGDKLYTFLMEWQPEMYGDQEETGEREKFFFDLKEVKGLIKPLKKTSSFREEKSVDDEASSEEKEVEKSWEILSKEEVYCAEKSQGLHKEDTIDESSLPELIGQTQFIEPFHILSLVRSLPRNMTVGYNWELTYATHKHGYSLQNLYQKMENVDDSPTILFIRDSNKCVFGAFMSHLMKPSDTFYGSGSTFLFTFYPQFRKFLWQGDNQFFMYGTKDSFAIGSGEGLFGLWLDGDLNKGRSHECSTFHNDVLSKEEDFVIIDLEVWRFVDSSM